MRIVSHPLTTIPNETDTDTVLAALNFAFTPEDSPSLPELLFINIETTERSKGGGQIYLISCAFHTDDKWMLIQWFDENGLEESKLLSSFLIFLSDYKYLITYGGDRYILPFLRKRLAHHALSSIPESTCCFDLYKCIRPYKNMLGFPDLKQTTVEKAKGYERPAAYDQNSREKETLKKYRQYLANPISDFLSDILKKNEEELSGVLQLLSVSYFSILPDIKLTVSKAQANYYDKSDGTEGEELFLFFDLAHTVPFPMESSFDGCYMKLEGKRGLLKIPMYTEDLKYFYANYKDYYYLPAEDIAVHKSLSSYVDKSRRMQARADNCYTRKTATFLPEWDLFRAPFFKREYGSDQLFFEFTADLQRSRQFLSAYAFYIFRKILSYS